MISFNYLVGFYCDVNLLLHGGRRGTLGQKSPQVHNFYVSFNVWIKKLSLKEYEVYLGKIWIKILNLLVLLNYTSKKGYFRQEKRELFPWENINVFNNSFKSSYVFILRTAVLKI